MQQRVFKWCFTIILLLVISACCSDDDSPAPSTNCDQVTMISSELFMTAPADPLFIHSMEIDDNCLQISFSASGCDGNSWETMLVDSEVIMESNPPQRNLRLSLKNLELCDAVISKTISFDISNLQVDGDQVLLTIANSGDEILYSY